MSAEISKRSNFTIRRTVNHRPKLTSLLLYFGVLGCTNTNKGRHGLPVDRNRGMVSQMPVSKLYDLYERTEAVYRARIREAHPDVGGSNEAAVELNTAWSRTKELFGRLGIP